MNQTLAPGIELDEEHGILTIDGIKYDRALFKYMGQGSVDEHQAFQIIRRDDGIVTLKHIVLPYGGVPVVGRVWDEP